MTCVAGAVLYVRIFVLRRATEQMRAQNHHAIRMLPHRSGLIVYQHVIQNATDVLRMDGHNILELEQPAQDYVKVLLSAGGSIPCLHTRLDEF